MKTWFKIALLLGVIMVGGFGSKQTATAYTFGSRDFGQTCDTTLDCKLGLRCNNVCVECFDSSSCTSGDICTSRGVCRASGGNPLGGFCTANNDCASNKCASNNRCNIGSGGGLITPTPTPTASGNSGLSDLPGVDLTIQDVADIITALACWLLRIITAVIIIFLILAGIRFMAAGANPTKRGDAIKNFNYVLVGVLIVMSTYVIIATVAKAVGVTNFSFLPLVC